MVLCFYYFTYLMPHVRANGGIVQIHEHVCEIKLYRQEAKYTLVGIT